MGYVQRKTCEGIYVCVKNWEQGSAIQNAYLNIWVKIEIGSKQRGLWDV